MTFDEYLKSLGYAVRQGEDDSYQIINPQEGNSLSGGDLHPLLSQFYETQRYSSPDVWGTAGIPSARNLIMPGQFGMSFVGEDGLDDIGTGERMVNIGGSNYLRTGTADNSRFDPFGGGYFQDPTYGWVVDPQIARAYSQSKEGFFDKYGVALAGLGLGAVTAPATGLFGAGEGGNVLEGMDLSGYLTNTDYGSGLAELTSGLEGASSSGFDWSKLGGVDDFGMDTLPGLIDGPVRTTAEGMATSFGGSIPPWLESVFTPGTNSARLLGQLGSSALGAYGANQQAGAYGDAQNRYLGLGAPARDMFYGTFAPGYDVSKEPGLKSTMDAALDTFMRSASAGNVPGVSSGNPWGNPGALMEGNKFLVGNVGLPYLQNTRNTLAAAGQLGVSQSAPMTLGQIQSQGGVYDALGYGLQGVLNPKPDYNAQILDIMRSWKPNTGSTNV